MQNLLAGIEELDPESQRLLREIAASGSVIQFEELEKGIYGKGKDPFEGIRTDKTFQEMSNEVAMDSPFGKNSAFYRELREIITGQIPKL